MKRTDYQKYLVVLLITMGVFFVVFTLVNTINNRRIASIEDLQQSITADLIATETQFDLLKTAPCEVLEKGSVLSRELGEFGQKLEFAQSQGADDPDVQQLKKYYSLLQVKDYLLMQEIADKCGTHIDAILYFYATECEDCIKQGYDLTEFKKRYPEIRIYSFDTDLDFSVIDTFAGLYDFDAVYPTLIINNKVYQSFQTLDNLEALLPEIVAAQVLQDRIDEGRNYILSLPEYDGVQSKDIENTNVMSEVYTYTISGSDTDMVLRLVFDPVTNEFSLDE